MLPSAVQAAVQQAVRVPSGMVTATNSDIRRRLIDPRKPGKVALFKEPDQVWTDIPEHSDMKGTKLGAKDHEGELQRHSSILSSRVVVL
jgi:hypothetical protein